MNGPEHYVEAERLLAQADRNVSENWIVTGEHKADILAAAQVHADLAHVAATIAAGSRFRYAEYDGIREEFIMDNDKWNVTK